jgi:hypothetical protein
MSERPDVAEQPSPFDDLLTFFPPGTMVCGLPKWRSARLLIPKNVAINERWNHSALYPGFRPTARLFRACVRIVAVAGLGKGWRPPTSAEWRLGRFLETTLPEARTVSVLIGTPGPAQKTIIEIHNAAGVVIGYLKYAKQPAAVRRVRQEHEVLSSGLARCAPKVLNFGVIWPGYGLLVSPLYGQPIRPNLLPTEALVRFARAQVTHSPIPLSAHPWVCAMNERTGGLAAALTSDIPSTAWPMVVQHGDLAPWNIRVLSGGLIGAFDWEYATQLGFPYLDLLHYVMSVSLLILKESPAVAARSAAEWLARAELGVPVATVRALTRLSALSSYVDARDDGVVDHEEEQPAWRAIWEDQW